MDGTDSDSSFLKKEAGFVLVQLIAAPSAYFTGPERGESLNKILTVLVVLILVTMLVAACAGPGGGGSTDVHMGNISFTQSSVTISKGSSLNLIDDVAVVHIIGNGSWKNGESIPASEPDAPTVNNLQFSSAGESHMVGPFNTAGTFHLYCSVHEKMNLTVIVQ